MIGEIFEIVLVVIGLAILWFSYERFGKTPKRSETIIVCQYNWLIKGCALLIASVAAVIFISALDELSRKSITFQVIILLFFSTIWTLCYACIKDKIIYDRTNKRLIIYSLLGKETLNTNQYRYKRVHKYYSENMFSITTERKKYYYHEPLDYGEYIQKILRKYGAKRNDNSQQSRKRRGKR